MGLLSKMTGMFRSEQTGASSRPVSPSASARAPNPAKPHATTSMASSGSSATALAEPKPPRTPPLPGSAVEVLPAKSASKSSRHELVEELQQNYREVVKIVRRVNEHMDKADARAEKITRLSEQVLEATRQLPAAMGDAIERAQQRQLDALQTIAHRQEEGTERIENTMAQLGIQLEATGQSHEQLVDSMTGFRDTMHEMSATNMRTAEALDASIAQKRAADDRLASMIVQNQRWMIGIVAGIMVFAASAFIVAVIALLQLQG